MAACVRACADLVAVFTVCRSSDLDWPTTETINRKLGGLARTVIGRWRQQYDGWNACAAVRHRRLTVRQQRTGTANPPRCKLWHIEAANDGDRRTEIQPDRRWYRQATAGAELAADARGLVIEASIHSDVCGHRRITPRQEALQPRTLHSTVAYSPKHDNCPSKDSISAVRRWPYNQLRRRALSMRSGTVDPGGPYKSSTKRSVQHCITPVVSFTA